VTRRQSTEGFVARASDRLEPTRTRVAFSLFEGDLVNRGFDAIGLRSRRGIDLMLRSLLLMGTTWGVVAVAALLSTQVRGVPASENFFKDFAAYLQFIIGLPLFVVAERIVSEHTREAANYFLVSGVVSSADIPLVEALHRQIERLRKSTVPDALCIILAYSLALATIGPKTTSICPSWHTTPNPEWNATAEQVRQEQRAACSELLRQRQAEAAARDAIQGAAKEPAAEPKRYPSHLNLAGWLEMLVALPLLNYWWLRWIWKIILWSWYLWRMSRRQLVLTATHPDATGGIGFISDVQTKFGFVILAYGVSNIASSVSYQVGVEHAPWSLYTVWCPLLIFVVASPALSRYRCSCSPSSFTVPRSALARSCTKRSASVPAPSIVPGEAPSQVWLCRTNYSHGSSFGICSSTSKRCGSFRSICAPSANWSARHWARWSHWSPISTFPNG
jgi:hypothetical protein